jgi:AraC-like DNA-binding protein
MPLVLPGQEVSFNDPERKFERHHHLGGYAALLVSGSCDEAGDRGRFRLRPGNVLIHEAFEAHQDHIGATGAYFINFALPASLGSTFGEVCDLDAIVLAHERDPREAVALLLEGLTIYPRSNRDWPDLLAEDLAMPRAFRLDDWAVSHGLNPASLSRGFRNAYGVTPKRYRFEQLASTAARAVGRTNEPLSHVAAACGFADQAHMTRALRSLFGLTPRQLRRHG